MSYGSGDFDTLIIPQPLGDLTPDQASVRAGELEQAVIDTLTTY